MKALGYLPIFNVEIPLEFRGFVQRIGPPVLTTFSTRQTPNIHRPM